MLAARPTSTLHTPPFQSKASTSKKAGIFSPSSTLNCFNSSVDRHFASIILPNFVSRSSRPRKLRIGGSKWTSTLFDRFRIEASLAAEDNACIEEAPLPLQPSAPYSIKVPVGDRHIFVETGHVGRQASGAVTVTDGETIIHTTVCMAEDPSEPSDFFPLSVNYQERFSAAGRTSGGFFKREGKTKDHEVLICRLIDRPLRPTMLKGFYHETQILSWVVPSATPTLNESTDVKLQIYEVYHPKKLAYRVVLSYDGLHPPDSLAVTAAGIAIALSEVPNSKAIAGVRIGLIDDKFVVNPTTKEIENSKLDLLLAGTDSAILMIEGYCDFLPEEKLLQAVEVGQNAVRIICKEVETLVTMCGKPKMLDAIKLPPPELYKHVEEIAGHELVQALQIKNKIPRKKALSSLEAKVLSIFTEKGFVSKTEAVVTSEVVQDLPDDEEEDEEFVVDGEVDEGDVHIKPVSKKPTPLFYSEVDVKLVFKEVSSKFLRRRIVKGGKRSDGRKPEDLRLINSRCGFLPRAHGSALFTRGETQTLAVVTLGDKQMAQRLDNLMDEDEFKRFYLQYSFPPSCVGEVGRQGAPSRREIGHGMLAERALEPILPSEDHFPYTIRVESTITESNGSSSMASVCGGCLALQDAGVPVKSSISGIAMGMVLNTEEFGGDGTPLILSDITGAEDASGDMDFKVAGNEDGLTAFQMDIKVGGITIPVMKEALLQAREGRKQILAEMSKCFPPPSKKLSKYAPIIHVMKVKPERVNLIIGSGGKKVKSIIEETGVDSIEAQDNGIIKITSKDLSSLEKSKAMISNLTMVLSVGDIYRNCEIKSIAPYGVFVEISPGREGLCHISELSSSWLAKAEDAVKVGDTIDVKLIEINGKGQLRLSRRALLPDSNTQNSGTNQLTVDLGEESIEKSKRKRVSKAVEVENAELSDEISVDIKVTRSSKSKPVESNTLMEDKFVKNLVSSAKDALESERSRTKKRRNKPAISVSSKNETAAVNGDGKSG